MISDQVVYTQTRKYTETSATEAVNPNRIEEMLATESPNPSETEKKVVILIHGSLKRLSVHHTYGIHSRTRLGAAGSREPHLSDEMADQFFLPCWQKLVRSKVCDLL
jgi:hypothetical protein